MGFRVLEKWRRPDGRSLPDFVFSSFLELRIASSVSVRSCFHPQAQRGLSRVVPLSVIGEEFLDGYIPIPFSGIFCLSCLFLQVEIRTLHSCSFLRTWNGPSLLG